MSDCHYEVHAKTAKDMMLREIQQLQRRNEVLEEENNSLAEKHAWVERIIKSFRPVDGMRALAPTSEKNLAAAIERYHEDLVGELISRTPPPVKID